MQAKKSVLMEYPLDNQKRPYKGVFKKMCRRIPGRENHYLGVSSSLWNFAVDLSWLALGYIRYFWSLDTWKDTMWFQGTGGWWGLERPMENSSMRANRRTLAVPRTQKNYLSYLHLEEDPSWKASLEEVICQEIPTEVLTFFSPLPPE